MTLLLSSLAILLTTYMLIYVYQYRRQVPSKTKFDESAERTISNKPVKTRSIPSYYVFQPLKIRGLTLRNRIIKSATYESASKNGKVTDTLINFHLSQAQNAAMVTVSYGCISREGRTFPDQLMITKENKDGLKRLTKRIHNETEAAISIQLTHAGLMAEPFDKNQKILCPSPLWSWSALQFAQEMSAKQIKTKIKQFAHAALLCKQCGFDAITLHCGHGYLISQFLSKITNERTDEYGAGSLESRCKFAADIVKEIRRMCGENFPIFIKINSHDGVDKESGGQTVDECIEFCKMLLRHGADVIIPSAGFILKNGIFMMRGSVPIYRMIKEATSWIKKIGIGLVGPWLIPKYEFRSMFLLETSRKLLNGLEMKENEKGIVCYLGGITSLKDINNAFEAGFELISIGRALLREPDFLDKIKKNKEHVSLCDHQNRCIIGQMSGKPLRCYAINEHKF